MNLRLQHKISIKKSRKAMTLLWFYSAQLAGSQLSSPASRPNHQRAKAVTLVGGLCGLGLLGYKLYRCPKKDMKLEHGAKKIGPDVSKKISEYAIETEFELLAYEDRVKLLPAITRGSYFSFWLNDAEERFGKIEVTKQPAEPIAIVARLISESFQRQSTINERLNNIIDQQNKSKFFYVKNKAHPTEILGTPLRPGECGLIKYSDSSLGIYLHDSDRRALNNLTQTQREFIKGLYARKGQGPIQLTSQESTIFKLLTPEVKAILKENYALKDEFNGRIISKSIGCAILLAGLASMFKITLKQPFLRLGCLLSTVGLGVVYFSCQR